MRLSKRQLRNLLRYGEVRFGDDDLKQIAALTEQAKKNLEKFYATGPVAEIRKIIGIKMANVVTRRDFENTEMMKNFKKAMDGLNTVYMLLERVKENAKQGK